MQRRNGCCCCPARSDGPVGLFACLLLPVCLTSFIIVDFTYILYYMDIMWWLNAIERRRTHTRVFLCMCACTSCIAFWLYIQNTHNTHSIRLYSPPKFIIICIDHMACVHTSTHKQAILYTTQYTHRATHTCMAQQRSTHTHEQYNYYFVWHCLLFV